MTHGYSRTSPKDYTTKSLWLKLENMLATIRAVYNVSTRLDALSGSILLTIKGQCNANNTTTHWDNFPHHRAQFLSKLTQWVFLHRCFEIKLRNDSARDAVQTLSGGGMNCQNLCLYMRCGPVHSKPMNVQSKINFMRISFKSKTVYNSSAKNEASVSQSLANVIHLILTE